MNSIRYSWCLTAILILTLAPSWGVTKEKPGKPAGRTPTAQASKQPLKRYRIIFNLDSSGVLELANWRTSADGDLSKYIQDTFTGLENSDVGALFWMDGAGGNTANYDSKVLELTGQRIGKVRPLLRRMIDEGNDPPKVVVREAKKRGLDVFFSFRINDTHDAGGPGELPTYKVQHPEWLIGKQPYGLETALNFAIPEVRRIKFAIIEEIFQKYDFDGLEIDFMRIPPFFIPGEEPKNAPILTQFLRDARQHLNRRGRERGRPIRLAARVDENLQACRLDGFDVATWLKEGLLDYLALGSGVMDVEVEAFKRLAKGTGTLIYACLYGWPGGYMPVPPEVARGLALNYWFQGADGIYTFNWFPFEPDKGYQVDLLNEIGDPKKLRFKPVMFAASRGAPDKSYPHNCMQCAVPATLTEGKVVQVPLVVGEDLVAASRQRPLSRLELRVTCERLAPGDQLEVALNGKPVAAQRLDESRLERTLPHPHLAPGAPLGPKVEETVLAVTLKPEEVKQGKNLVTLRLPRRDPQAEEGMINLKAVEIHVDYQ